MGFTGRQIQEIEQVLEKALAKEELVKTLQKNITEALTGNLSEIVQSAVAIAVKTAVSDLQEKCDTLTRKIEAIKTNTADMEKKFVERMSHLEQYSRRNNIRIFGVPEEINENTEEKLLALFTTNLKVTLPPYAIDRVHRIGRPQNRTSPRAIIVKFSNYTSYTNANGDL